ncbi:hypothetical protein VNI00_000021 [Paramarasmius palmivorus]|uniref:Wings apart-like protein C-terminal domain-containing protein n=1 Tax=Paramarasmius palmivorus TaxID=297713 RepID=A0AAW0EBX2_9AGAR
MSLPRTYSRRPAKRRAEPPEASETQKKLKLDSEPPSSLPKQKPRLARDLSQIFDDATASLASSSKPVPASPSKVAKRMLGRSKTDSSITSEPTTPTTSRIMDRTASLPSGFGSPSSSKQPPSHSLPPSPVKHLPEIPASPRRTVSHKRTYAGKSRTFLVALPVDSSLTSLEPGMSTGEDEYLNRESYASLQARWGIDAMDDDPMDDRAESVGKPGSAAGTPTKGKGKGKSTKGKLTQDKQAAPPVDIMKPLKSITEIRNKGESRRFLDEVGYLLEGMDKHESAASRRTSALEITNRLCEVDFARQAKAADFLIRTWEAFIEAGAGNGEDKASVIARFHYSELMVDLGSLTDIIQRAQVPGSSTSNPQLPFVSTLFALLSLWTSSSDPLQAISQATVTDAQLRRLGIMKNDRFLLQSIHTTIVSKSGLFAIRTNISSILLITRTLSLVPPTYLSPTRHLKPLLQSLENCLRPLIVEPPDTKTGPGGSGINGNGHSRIPSPSAQVPFAMIHNLLGLLDSYLLRQWRSEDADLDEALDRAREEWLASGMVGLGVHAEVVSANKKAMELDDQEPADVASATKCTELLFRVLVSLTHGDHDWSASVLHEPSALTYVTREICRADEARRNATAVRKNGSDKKKSNGKRADKMVVLDLTDSDEEDSKDGILDKQQYSATEALDRLCLALGLLTNLVQVVDDAKDIMRETEIDPKCILKAKPCPTACTCSNPISILNILVDVYRNQTSHSAPPLNLRYKAEPRSPTLQASEDLAEDADASFLLGHISILFGLLMLDNRANQNIIINALPPDPGSGSGSKWSKLDRMLDNARALGAFYTAISRRMDRNNGGEAEDSDDSDEENHHGRRGDRLSDAARGANIAQDVIVFLQRLRDSIS